MHPRFARNPGLLRANGVSVITFGYHAQTSLRACSVIDNFVCQEMVVWTEKTWMKLLHAVVRLSELLLYYLFSFPRRY